MSMHTYLNIGPIYKLMYIYIYICMYRALGPIYNIYIYIIYIYSIYI